MTREHASTRPPAPSLRATTGAYRRLCSAVAISEAGDWLLFIALPLYVLQASGSALSTSTVFLAELAPAVVVGILCGPLVDRCSAGRLLTGLTCCQALVLVPLLSINSDRLWIVYLVAGVQAAITSLTTPAQQAMVPALVPASQLPRANAMVQMASNTARLVGSPLGGLLLPLVGLHVLVLGDMISFVAAAALLAACRRVAPRQRGSREADHSGPLAAVADGWSTVRTSRALVSALVISCVASIAQGLFLVLFVLFVLRSMHAGDQAVGLLRGVQAIGGVLGGVVVGAWSKRLAVRSLSIGGLAGFGLISLLTWNSPAITTAIWWYVGLFIAVGLPSTAFVTGLLTGAQRASPPRTLGRVLSLLAVAQALGEGAGILAAGLLSSTISLAVLLDVQASLYLACAVIAAFGLCAITTSGAVGPGVPVQ
jgi:MFS family permease